MPADLFVSYARADRERVLSWVQRLRDAGLSLWFDEADIPAGHVWSREIADAIQACRVVLLMVSPASAASPGVGREVSLASEGGKPILPLRLAPTPLSGSIHYHLADVQHLELSGADPEATRIAILRALAQLGVAAPAGASTPTTSPSEPARPTPEPAPNNLPEPLTSFIGREREIAAVKECLASHRLVTLTGTGGTGKTRLALQVAGELQGAYPDGVWLVELAALADPTLVPQEVGRALGLREELGRPLVETLIVALRPRRLLLVMDNCEHLLPACTDLAHAVLRACPGVRVLATSRQVLCVPGEALFRVPSLAVPVPPPPPLEQLTQYEAVRLFIDRVLLTQPGFTITNANAPAVAAICHRLDGIPLAIELAAARVKVLSPEQLMARLDDRFRLLTGGGHTALPRHQTLRATLDWSYDQLTEAERTLLQRLSEFAGGFSLEAAETVCAGDGIAPEKVLDLLTQLTDKSLLLVEEGAGEARYRLLETIRQYGAEKLARLGEAEALRGRHRDWCLALAEQAAPELQGPAQGRWLARLEQEHDNLRAALMWTSERREGEAGLRLGGALWRFWYVRGYLSEGRERLATSLAVAGPGARDAARAQALYGAGVLACCQGGYEAARALHAESLSIQRERGDQPGIASSLTSLGTVAWRQGEYEGARALYEESLAMQRQLDDQHGIASSLGGLGLVSCDQGDYAAAQALHAESLAIRRKLGDQKGIAASLGNLGNVAYWRGDYETAKLLHAESLAIQRQLGDQQCITTSLGNLGNVAHAQGDYGAAKLLHEESLMIRRQLGDQHGIALSLGNLGLVAYDQADYEAARALYAESLVIRRQLGDQFGTAYNLEGLASAAAVLGQPERAARLFGAAEALRDAIGAPLPPNELARYERDVAAARAALDEEAFAAAWAEGRALPLEQAITFALAPAEPPAPPPTTA